MINKPFKGSINKLCDCFPLLLLCFVYREVENTAHACIRRPRELVSLHWKAEFTISLPLHYRWLTFAMGARTVREGKGRGDRDRKGGEGRRQCAQVPPVQSCSSSRQGQGKSLLSDVLAPDSQKWSQGHFHPSIDGNASLTMFCFH